MAEATDEVAFDRAPGDRRDASSPSGQRLVAIGVPLKQPMK